MYRKIVLDTLHRERESEQTLVLRRTDRASIVLDITVTEGGETFDGSMYEARMFAEFGGGRIVIDPVTAIDASTGRYSYTLPPQFSATAGSSVHAYLRFNEPDGSVSHSTDSIRVVVKESADVSPGKAGDWISEFDELRDRFGEQITEADAQKKSQQAGWLEQMDGQRRSYEAAETSRDERSEAAVGKLLADAESGRFDASVAVGRTETAPAGEQAEVVNVGTPKDAVFDFYIPKGRDGAVIDLAPGVFAMSIDGSGHLILSHSESDPAPPLSIDGRGNLVYMIGD